MDVFDLDLGTQSLSLSISPARFYPNALSRFQSQFEKKKKTETNQTSSTLTSPSSLVSRSLTLTNGPPSASHSLFPSR